MIAGRFARPDLQLLLAGSALTLATALLATELNGTLVLTSLAGLAFFAGTVVCFVVAPHVAVAATIPLFAILPMVRVLVAPSVGPVKDAVTIAAAVALLVIAARAREEGIAWLDRKLGIALGALLVLYVINIGGVINGTALDAGWMHGVRLVAEPLLLLLVGLAVGNERTLRWAMISLAATACVVALVGVYQQLIGGDRLVGLGYEYDTHVRTIGGRLRSFGTLDEPFAYAAFLTYALVAAFFWFRQRAVVATLIGILGVGLLLSQVRTAGLITIALFGLWLARRRFAAIAAFVLAAVAIAGLMTPILLPGATETQSVRTSGSTYLTVNGRTEAWRIVFETPGALPLGKGVGVVGTAAERAQIDAHFGSVSPERDTTAVDSGYFAALADVGIAGLVLIVFVFIRLGQLAYASARQEHREGWLALALVIALTIDALTRSSFTAFPTAFLGLLLVGVALGAARTREAAGAATHTA